MKSEGLKMRGLFVALMVGCLAGCENAEEGLRADAAMGMPSVDGAAPPRCLAHADCDDGLFCNGLERCAPNARGADVRGCIAGTERRCANNAGCTEAMGGACDARCPDADGDGYASATCGGLDCDDRDGNRYPDNPEVCDAAGHDEDCDPCTVSASSGRDGDRDLDGYVDQRCSNEFRGGAPSCPSRVSVVPGRINGVALRTGRVQGADCNDDPAREGAQAHPFQTEVCGNLRDDDCDGQVDRSSDLHADTDNDGRGDPLAPLADAFCGPGAVANVGDCDDRRRETYRGAPEQCDGRDNDCSLPGDHAGSADRTEDWDGDGHSPPSATCLSRDEAGALGSAFPRDDCDDRALSIHPGAAEICGNRLDEDCDGTPDDPLQVVCVDRDGDRHGDPTRMRTVARCELLPGEVPEARCDDCDETERLGARRFPGNREICDGVDNDCSTPRSQIAPDEDADGDNYAPIEASCAGRGEAGAPEGAMRRGDCDDSARAINPGARELCDGDDSDCSSGGGAGHARDEDADGDGHAPTNHVCATARFPKDDCDDTRSEVHGGRSAADDRETCDGVDNDCNAATSELTHREGCAARGGGYCHPGGVCGRGPQVMQLAAGAHHTCARLGDGSVWCWGSNFLGALGDGTSTSRSSPVHVTDLPGALEIAVGADHTCALVGDGSVWCWGGNDFGQLGNGTRMRRSSPRPVTGISGAVEVAVGRLHSCARINDGSVRCWGANFDGQLGDESSIESVIPVPVAGISGVVEIAMGSGHTCARINDGTVRCWGANSDGQLGNNSTTNSSSPVLVMGLTGAVEMALGNQHSCVRLGDGAVRCWGRNLYGELGDGTTISRSRPVSVEGLAGAMEIEVGHFHSCARLADGSMKCWGSNSSGQLGDGTTRDRSRPVSVAEFTTVAEIALGWRHSCVRLGSGSIQCWGNNDGGQLGNGTTTERSMPSPVLGPFEVVEIAAGDELTCARLVDRSVRCWGAGFVRGLAGMKVDRSRPSPVMELSGVAEIAVGRTHSCARLDSGSARCWGLNHSGQLDGTTMDHLSHVAVPNLVGVSEISAGDSHSCALLGDGTIQCWGSNDSGQLGSGSMTDFSRPSLIIGLPHSEQITTGGSHSCARLGGGTVRCWGSNRSGQLGDRTDVNRSEPVPVMGLSGAVEIAAGSSHTCARLDDSSVRCWGLNLFGQLGNSSTTSSSSPVLVAGLTGAVEIALGGRHSCARIIDGTVQCWGSNAQGELGDGTATLERLRPVPVIGINGAVEIAAGDRHTCARLDTGAVLCWGDNHYDQLGDGTRISHRVPTLIPDL